MANFVFFNSFYKIYCSHFLFVILKLHVFMHITIVELFIVHSICQLLLTGMFLRDASQTVRSLV